MKRFLILLGLILLSIVSFTQTPFKTPQGLGAKGTRVQVRDQLLVDSILYTQRIGGGTLNENDYEIIVLPDLQLYNSTPNIPPQDSMFNWIVRNKTIENIQGVIQVGDLTDFATNAEFIRADTQFDKLHAIGLWYLYVLGNHDYDGNVPSTRLTTNYNTLFGPSRYTGVTYYGGNMDGVTNDNYFITLKAGADSIVVIGLEFCPRDTALNWAQRIMDSLPNRKTIIVTHAYIARSGERSIDTTQFAKATYGVVGNDGEDMWNKLIRKNKQIFLTLNGHFINPFSTPVVKRITEAGDHGNVIQQLVVNYQTDGGGGNGYLMRLKFRPRVGKLDISFYSPFLQQYDTRFPAYSVDYPGIAVGSAVGISSVNGSLNVAGEVMFDSTVSFIKLRKNRFAKITDVGRITTDSIKYSDITNVTAGAIPYGGTNNQLTFNVNQLNWNPTLNRLGVGTPTPLKAIDSRFSMGVSAFALGYPTLLGGLPANLYVTHGGGNWGLAVTRHDLTARAANLVFFSSNNTDPTVNTTTPVGRDLGRISFHGVSDANTARVFGDLAYRVTNNADLGARGQFLFATGSDGSLDYPGSLDLIKMMIDGDGNVSISKNPANVGMKLYVGGKVGIHKDSIPIVTSITTEYVLVIDSSTFPYQIKRILASNLPNGGGSSYTFTNGLTEAAGTVTNDLITGISGNQTIIGSTSTNSGLNIRATSGVGVSGSDIKFQVGNNGATEAMRILHDGNVGIGTTSPLVKLDLPTNNTTNSIARFGSLELQSYQPNNAWMADNSFFDGSNFVYRNNGTAGMFRFNLGSFNVYSAASGTAGNPISWQIPFTVDADGDVGVNNTTPSAKLHVTGSVKLELGSDADYDIYFRGSGGDVNRLAAATDGQVLTTHGTSSAPTWTTPFTLPSFTGIAYNNGTTLSATTIGDLLQMSGSTLQFHQSYMTSLPNNQLRLKSRMVRQSFTVADADFTTLATRQEGFFILPDITANRSFNMFSGTGAEGHEFYVYNNNTTGNTWSFAGVGVFKASNGASVTTMTNGVLYQILGLFVGGSARWIVVNQ